MYCVPCAVRSIADMAAEPPAKAAYVIDGLSLCGPCALPRLYALANGSQLAAWRKDPATRLRDAQPLFAALSEAHAAAGYPSLRAIARTASEKSGRPLSHTSVHEVFTGKRVPSYRVIEDIAVALGADKNRLTSLWKAAR